MSFAGRGGLSRWMTAKETPRSAAQDEPSARPLRAPRRPPEPGLTVLVLHGPIAPADIPSLCERARPLLEESKSDVVVCDVRTPVDPDVVTVAALARLQLTARRLGRRVRLRQPCGGLEELLVLMGLTDVFPPSETSELEPRREAEEREQARGLEEEGDPGDPPV
jgi:ABC-type transporter Mla MlaB component